MEGLLGAALMLGFGFLIILVVSKATNSNVTYRGGQMAAPDDLDKIVRNTRGLVDKEYKKFKEIQDEYLNECKIIDAKLNNLVFKKVQAPEILKEKGFSEQQINEYIENTFDMEISELVVERAMLNGKYTKLAGRPIKPK